MRYDNYQYLWPPRPKKAIPDRQLGRYERKGWVAQMKKNGTCTVVFVAPDGEITWKTRHNDDHKAWVPSNRTAEVFQRDNLPGKGWYVFVVEVLHNKTKQLKDTVYIFDILVNDGELLLNTTFTERMDMLKEIYAPFIHEDDNVISLGGESHYTLTPNCWLAKTITEDFEKVMRIANQQKPDGNAPVDEGIVLKRPNAKLVMPTKESANSTWQVKCRVAHKNYDF